MKFKILALLALVLSLNTLLPASLAGTAAAAEDTEKTISYLLDYVSKSDLIFIRNGQEATAKQAADHLRQKWEYFRSRIKTPAGRPGSSNGAPGSSGSLPAICWSRVRTSAIAVHGGTPPASSARIATRRNFCPPLALASTMRTIAPFLPLR